MSAAGWEVIARAGLYIARLADTEITGSVAGWMLRSVERDLIDDCRRARRTSGDLAVDDPTGDTAPQTRRHQAPSAEDAALAGPLVWSALSDATRRGALFSVSARVVLLHAAGHSLPAAGGRRPFDRQRRTTQREIEADLALRLRRGVFGIALSGGGGPHPPSCSVVASHRELNESHCCRDDDPPESSGQDVPARRELRADKHQPKCRHQQPLPESDGGVLRRLGVGVARTRTHRFMVT